MQNSVSFWGFHLPTPPWGEGEWALWTLDRLGLPPIASAAPSSEEISRAQQDIALETGCSFVSSGAGSQGARHFVAYAGSVQPEGSDQGERLSEPAANAAWRETLEEFSEELGLEWSEPRWRTTAASEA
jgi:hypothetical protein